MSVHIHMPVVSSPCNEWRACIMTHYDPTLVDENGTNHAMAQLAAVNKFQSQSERSLPFSPERFDGALFMTRCVLSRWRAVDVVCGPKSRDIIRMIMAFEGLLNSEGIFADEDGAACAYGLRVALSDMGFTEVTIYLNMNILCDEVFMLDLDVDALATNVYGICRLISEGDHERLEWHVDGFDRAFPLIHAFDQVIENIIPDTIINGRDIAYRFDHIFDMIDELDDFRNGDFYATVLGYALIGTWERCKIHVNASHALIDNIDTMLWELCATNPVLKDLLTSFRIRDDPREPMERDSYSSE